MNKAQRMKGSMEKTKLEERPAGTGGAEPQSLAENLKFYSEPGVPTWCQHEGSLSATLSSDTSSYHSSTSHQDLGERYLNSRSYFPI